MMFDKNIIYVVFIDTSIYYFLISRVVYPMRAENGGYVQFVLASTYVDELEYSIERQACV